MLLENRRKYYRLRSRYHRQDLMSDVIEQIKDEGHEHKLYMLDFRLGRRAYHQEFQSNKEMASLNSSLHFS